MSGTCCENGRSLVNPQTGQTVCSCHYSPGLITYSRMGLPDPVYTGPAYSTAPGYVSLGADPSAFYPPLNSPYELKEAGETWRGLGQSPSCYPYDPTSMPQYPYSNAYGGMDINSAARRKNATRENTNTLKAWLYEHRKNPYPTKGEKIMLAIITKMTLTQVSTWFANARRRLKKENKMTWSPRNKPGGNDGDDDDDDDDEDDSKDKADNTESDGENAGRKSPKDQKKSCDREGQLSNDVTEESSPCTTMRTVRMYDTSIDSTHMSRSRLPGITDHSLRNCSGTYSTLHMSATTSPSFLNLPPIPRGYNEGVSLACVASSDGSVASGIDTASAPSSKRPDSLCSNSNDSGLSDANCGYPDPNMDGFRPKIWSLAHVATSDAGYSNMNNETLSPSGSSIPNLPRNIISSSHGQYMNSVPTMVSIPSSFGTHFPSGNNRHDGLQSSSSSSSSSTSSLSSFTPSPLMQPLPSSMPPWGPVYSMPSNLGAPSSKQSCQGHFLSQSLSGNMPGGHMVQSLNMGPHNSSPISCYQKGITPPSGYYPNSKMAVE